MISFKESWQIQRKQRQHEVVQRQQQVHEVLEAFQQERQIKAAELRQELQLFQQALQLDTQDFLAQATSERQAQAEHLMQQLHDFVQVLRQQTAQLLSIHATDRITMSRQLRQDLSEFHADLSLSVTLLRQALQQRMQELRTEVYASCAETQELLQVYRQNRIQNRIEQIQKLTEWTAALQAEVQNYLNELSLIRYDRAQQLKTMLQQENDRRRAENSELFQQLGQFRAELKAYRSGLRQMVWGETTPEQGSGKSLGQSKTNCAKAEKRPTGISQLQKPQTVATPQPAISQTNGHQSNKAAKPAAKRIINARRSPALQGSKLKTASGLSRLSSAQPSIAPTPPAANARPTVLLNPPAAAAPLLTDPLEQRVYNHIQQTQGARLTDIESALGINRFQTVDTLRILIKKGLVTQRDRTYLIQEELSL